MKTRKQKRARMFIIIALTSFFAFHIGKASGGYGKEIQLQAELDVINQEIQYCEKKLKILKQLRKEKETNLVLISY